MSEGKIVSKLSESLCHALPGTLGDMGITGEHLWWDLGTLLTLNFLLYHIIITGTFEEVFQFENFVVFKCSIGEIDQMTLLRGAKGEDFANHFQSMLDAFTALV